MELLTIASFLVGTTNRIVEHIIKPIFEKLNWDKFWLAYVSLVVGGGLVWLSGVNLFAAYLPDPLVGRILTAVVAGGGATLLHDVFDGK